MAGLLVAFTTAEQALVAATVKTLLRVKAPTNQRLTLKRWGIFFDGTTVTAEPVQVELLRQSTDGTSSANTGKIQSPAGAAEAVQTVGADTFTAEPTAGDILDVKECHPQGGYEFAIPADQPIDVQGGGRLAIRATAPGGVNARALLVVEE